MALAETLSEKGLPQNLLAERSVLGAILLDAVNFHLAAEILEPGDFHLDSHRKIFSGLRDLAHENVAIDYITLSDILERAHELEAVGGHAYLATLTDGLPRGINVEHYARIVKDRSIQRHLLAVAHNITDACLAGGSTGAEILNQAQREILNVAEDNLKDRLESLKDLSGRTLEMLDALRGNEISGLRTGYDELDRLTAGLQRSDLIVLAARPSMGKTSLAMNIVENMALRYGRNAAVFSLEMAKVQLVLRMLCSVASVSAHGLRSGFLSKAAMDSLVSAAGAMNACGIYIDDSSGIDLNQMRAKCRRLKHELASRTPPATLDLVVVDYLQLMASTGRAENRNLEITAISRGLKMLAKELEAPVIALSQLSRAPEQRKGDNRPILSDLRESGAIEQDADVVAFIYRDEVYNKNTEDQGVAEIIIAKQRNGPTGTVRLAWRRDFTRFENLADGQTGE